MAVSLIPNSSPPPSYHDEDISLVFTLSFFFLARIRCRISHYTKVPSRGSGQSAQDTSQQYTWQPWSCRRRVAPRTTGCRPMLSLPWLRDALGYASNFGWLVVWRNDRTRVLGIQLRDHGLWVNRVIWISIFILRVQRSEQGTTTERILWYSQPFQQSLRSTLWYLW